MTSLPWFPYDVDEWELRTRALSMEEEGALMRLCRLAWADAEPCTILDSPHAMERALGAKWKRLLPFVRSHFVPCGLTGRLRCDWLLALYDRQLAKHESYQLRGAQGGRPRKAAPSAPDSSGKAQRKPRGSSGKAQLSKQDANHKAGLSQSTTEGSSCAPTEHTATPPAPAGALGLGRPRAGGAVAAVSVTEGQVAHDALEERREFRLGVERLALAERWIAERPDIAAAIERELQHVDLGRGVLRNAEVIRRWEAACHSPELAGAVG
ncbi:MAG: hypothetical protein JWO05_1169 [Gemmatimonadetes bacterium]|nr:hypothetical protein [Gemmatimonadota bacterium]